ncbi:hypothetical protein JCM33374_g323 [Metschnikowia sp. JCM 33374]|nr:hypothetical protein JCM33374_g323 [Metschnikowia sp. JCM 33374]
MFLSKILWNLSVCTAVSSVSCGETLDRPPYQFKTAPVAPKQVIGALPLSKASLENQAYCLYDLDTFSFILDWINRENLQLPLVLLKNDFELKFKKCLSSDFLDELVTNLKAEGILKVEDTESSLIAQVPTPKLNTPGPKDSEEDDEVSPQPGTKRHKFTRAEKHEYWKSMETKRKSEASKNASNGNSNHD